MLLSASIDDRIHVDNKVMQRMALVESIKVD